MQKQPFPVGGTKKFEDWGWLKIFRTRGGVLILGEVTFAGVVSTPLHAMA